VVQVGQIEHLQVDALRSDLGVLGDLGYDLPGRAADAVFARLGGLAADRGGPAAELCFVLSAAHRVSHGIGDGIGVAADGLAGRADACEPGR